MGKWWSTPLRSILLAIVRRGLQLTFSMRMPSPTLVLCLQFNWTAGKGPVLVLVSQYMYYSYILQSIKVTAAKASWIFAACDSCRLNEILQLAPMDRRSF